MMDIQEHCMRFTGAKMDRAVPRVTNDREIVVSYHDECSAHSSEHCNRVWKIKGQGGQMKDKKRGQCAMVTAYCCAPIGLWIDS